MATTGATMTIRAVEAERTVSSDEFFQGVYLTAVEPGEMLTRVAVPAIAAGEGDGWASVTLGKDGTGIVNVAATVHDGQARMAIGCVSAVPIVVEAEADEVSVRKAVADADLDPPSDVHASADYRRHLAQVLAWRAVEQALGSAA
jgi:carbon-monoxide dehydrogenase medium subunit